MHAGFGEDAIFVSVVEPMKEAHSAAMLWVGMGGVVLCVDSHFVSNFG